MKKIFTLIAAVAMAASVHAQGTYAVAEGEAISSGQQITSVSGATLTFMQSDGKTYQAGKKVANWADEEFVAYTVGTENGKLVSGAAPTGCVYKIETEKAGSLTIGVQLSPNKGFHVLNADFSEVALSSYNLPADKDEDSQTLGQNDKGESIIPSSGTKSNGTVTFDVAAGGTYYVFAAGTKLGFFGFKYTLGTPTGITSIKAVSAKASATYNLAGQQVSDSYRGIVIKNGKKYVK